MGDPRRRRVAIGAAILASLLAVGAVSLDRLQGGVVTGTVIDLAGAPVPGARVAMGEAQALTGADGRFQVRGVAREGWIRADAGGFLPRLRPTYAGDDIVLRLTPDDGHTISMVFGGDVMFGRRFYDPNEDGDPSDGILSPSSTIEDHSRLLRDVAPALQAADLAVVNLETPLLAAAYVDATASRPPAFHPTKEFVFASAPASAAALREVGIDIVGIGNNHLYDALEPGVRDTMSALDAAGFRAGIGRAGGGQTAAEAWQPAVASARGQRVAVVACTTIDGHATPPTYVAAGATKGGAAACSDADIQAGVASARATADLVVMMIHGGFEYDRAASENIRHFSQVAHDAGATLVVNHHPHVVGGFESDGGGLTAWTIGNLVFDQTVWPTFESYLLTVYLRDGQPIRAVADPLIMDGFTPHPVVGDLAVHVARDAAGWDPGPFVVEDGAVEIAGVDQLRTISREIPATGPGSGAVFRLPGSARLAGAGLGDVLAGRDLLWTGAFEDQEIDGRERGAVLWGDGDGARTSFEGSVDGGLGIRLERTGASRQDVVLSPSHRVPVVPGTRLTLLAAVRGDGAAAAAQLQLSWFNDLRGASSRQTVVDIPAAPGWHVIRIDVSVPANAAAVLPLIRLASPSAGRSTLDVDDVRLIEWRDADAATLATDFLLVRGDARLTIDASTLPGMPEPGLEPMPITDEAPLDAPAV
ncbi:MAG: CapA family protein, partial [Candidatus Limnocylindrales bacterium]